MRRRRRGDTAKRFHQSVTVATGGYFLNLAPEPLAPAVAAASDSDQRGQAPQLCLSAVPRAARSNPRPSQRATLSLRQGALSLPAGGRALDRRRQPLRSRSARSAALSRRPGARPGRHTRLDLEARSGPVPTEALGHRAGEAVDQCPHQVCMRHAPDLSWPDRCHLIPAGNRLITGPGGCRLWPWDRSRPTAVVGASRFGDRIALAFGQKPNCPDLRADHLDVLGNGQTWLPRSSEKCVFAGLSRDHSESSCSCIHRGTSRRPWRTRQTSI